MRSIAASRCCRQRGFKHALVTAGGDSRIIGDRFGKPWVVGIRHPDRKDEVIARIPLEDAAISTSGDYERYFDENGVRYHHIIDPQTGHSASKVRSATIIGPTATRTDGLSKTAFVLGAGAGDRDLQPARRHRCGLVTPDGQVLYTKGLAAPEATHTAVTRRSAAPRGLRGDCSPHGMHDGGLPGYDESGTPAAANGPGRCARRLSLLTTWPKRVRLHACDFFFGRRLLLRRRSLLAEPWLSTFLAFASAFFSALAFFSAFSSADLHGLLLQRSLLGGAPSSSAPPSSPARSLPSAGCGFFDRDVRLIEQLHQRHRRGVARTRSMRRMRV